MRATSTAATYGRSVLTQAAGSLGPGPLSPPAPAVAPAVDPGVMVPEAPSGLSAAAEGGPLMEVVLAGGMPWLELVVWVVAGMPAGGVGGT